MNKNQRQRNMIKRLAVSPWTYTPEVLAQELGTSVSSIYRDIRELEANGGIFELDRQGRYFLRQSGWSHLDDIKDSTIRQLEILRFINSSRQGVNVQAMKRHFTADQSISEKTIERDLKELVRRQYINYLQGEYTLNFSQVLPPLSLEGMEKNLLAKALSLQGEFSARRDEAKSIAAKLQVSQNLMSEERETIVVHGRKPVENLRTGHYCSLLEQVAQMKEKIMILYRRGDHPAYETTVNPLGIVYYWALDNWYLIAQEDKAPNEIKNYAVDRILAVELTGISFAIPEGFILENWFQYSWGVFRQGNPVKVTLRFYNYFETFRRVREELADRKTCVFREEQDTLIVEVLVDGFSEIAVWLRGYAPAVEVLDPPELRQIVIADLEKMLQNYGGNPSWKI